MYYLFDDDLDTFIKFKKGDENIVLYYYLLQYYKDINNDNIEESLYINIKKRKWNC